MKKSKNKMKLVADGHISHVCVQSNTVNVNLLQTGKACFSCSRRSVQTLDIKIMKASFATHPLNHLSVI